MTRGTALRRGNATTTSSSASPPPTSSSLHRTTRNTVTTTSPPSTDYDYSLLPASDTFSPKTLDSKMEKIDIDDTTLFDPLTSSSTCTEDSEGSTASMSSDSLIVSSTGSSPMLSTILPSNTQPAKKQLHFRTKEFKIRPSLLTTLFDGSAGIVFNFAIAVFILLLMATMMKDAIEHSNPFHHWWVIFWNFEQFGPTMVVWTGMFLSTYLVYGIFKYWSLVPAKRVTAWTEAPWILAFLGYLAVFFYTTVSFVFKYDLHSACSFIITCENTRISMKVYAFIRENVPRGIRRKKGLADGSIKVTLGESSKNWPSPQQWTYYFFCPSFLYRDSYPMTDTRSFVLVAKHFALGLCTIYYVDLLFIQFIQPYFHAIDYQKATALEIAYTVFPAIIPGFSCLYLLFYGLLHCWLNFFSELMFFGDRLFYSNWWSSRNMAEYYRNWNLVVHEWLYVYVYRDVANLIGGRTGLRIAQASVFFLSSVVHEYWFGVSLRVFYPIMFVLYFICGGIFFAISRFITKPYIWNVAMWFNLIIGTGMFVSCYATEWYARQRCPSIYDNFWVDLVMPRLWTC